LTFFQFCFHFFFKKRGLYLGSGTLYFTSIRKEKGAPYTVRASVQILTLPFLCHLGAFYFCFGETKQFDLELSVMTALSSISQIHLPFNSNIFQNRWKPFLNPAGLNNVPTLSVRLGTHAK